MWLPNGIYSCLGRTFLLFTTRLPGRVVQSWVKKTQGYWEIWIQMLKLNSKLSLILFVYTFVIGCSLKSRENDARKCFWTKEKNKPGLKFSPELALIGFRTTGPQFSSGKQGYTTRVSLTVLDYPLYMYYWSSWGDYVDQEVLIIVLLRSSLTIYCADHTKF